LAEQQTLNLRVLGSIPRRLTTFHRFHSEICDLGDPRADLSRPKRPADPVLSLLRLCCDFAPVTPSINIWRLSVRNPADRASCVQRCCRLDAVGRKRWQRTASEHPACDRDTAFIQRALRCSFSAHVGGVGCPFVAAIHPGASIHASFRGASAGVRCVVFGTCGRRQSY
jgi:hypothetical protein